MEQGIYEGTLTTYYRDDWENISQQWATELEIGEGGKILWQAESEMIEYDTESLAKFSFSIFYKALKFAEEH